ncbi:MAG: hypothetical protein QOJ76_2606 [Acidobacteriota bacterium]|jgi:ketosteroid isomerase-like protein|nr:hypothetical protein [Acidobacteriota bacterium]
MTKFYPTVAASSVKGLALILLLVHVAHARQGTQKKEPEPNAPANTSEAWRQALPDGEKAAAVEEAAPAAGAEESSEVIEKRLNALERKLMESVKLHDAAALKRIIDDDFTHTNAQTTGATAATDKAGYIEQAARDWTLTSYSFDKLTVRVYGNTAVVNASYKQQALVAGKDASGAFVATDVWVKRDDGRWRVVARHVGQLNAAR